MQFGAALARTLFDEAGAAGTVLLRTAFAAVVLMALWRPSVRGRAPRDLWLVAAFGASLGFMNLAFYESIDRIPLGAAVTFEFIGPLGVAVAGSRRRLDLLWVVLAAVGIVLLAAPGGGRLEVLGVVLALVAGLCWAIYILLGARIARAIPGGGGLALAMLLSTFLLIPAGVADGGSALLNAGILATGFAVAILSSAIPYSLEIEALRRMPQHVFGVLMSLEPALAAMAGLILLGETLGVADWGGIAMVVAASAGAAGTAGLPPPVDA